MAKSGGKKSFSVSLFRRRRQAANDRRFCIVWINRMVNKKVEKEITELHSEILFLFQALREEMVAEIQAQLRELTLEETGERHLLYRRLSPEQEVTSRWPVTMENEHEEKSEEDGNDDANPLGLDTSSFSVTFCEMSNVDSSGGSGGSDTSHSNTNDVSQETDTSSQPAKSDVATAADTSQLMKESEKRESSSSTNAFYANPSFMIKKQGYEVDSIKEGEALLMDRQWREWMDERERRENRKVHPVDQQRTEKQEGAAPPVSLKQMKLNMKEVNPLTKMRTRLSGLFNPSASYKRLEDED